MKVKIYHCRQCWVEISNRLLKFCWNKCFDKYQAIKTKEKNKQKREAKKISISALSKVADKLWSESIRSKWFCEHCWKKEYLNAHHLIWRHAKNTRWELSNWICLCSWCHTMSSEFSAHQNPLLFHKWLESYKWPEYINKLLELSNIPLHVTSEYLQEKIRSLKEN